MNRNNTEQYFDRSDPVDWDWFALAYVADELSADDQVWFEAQLASEETVGDAARFAVASAGERMGQIYAAVESAVADGSIKVQLGRDANGSNGSNESNVSMAWTFRAWKPVLVFAASVLLLLGGWMAVQTNSVSVSSDPPDDSLALAWVDTLEEPGFGSGLVEQRVGIGLEDPDRDDLNSAEELGLDDSLWMFAALVDDGEAESSEGKGL